MGLFALINITFLSVQAAVEVQQRAVKVQQLAVV